MSAAEPTLFGPAEPAPEPAKAGRGLVKDLVSYGIPGDVAAGYTVAQAHAVLKACRERAGKDVQAGKVVAVGLAEPAGGKPDQGAGRPHQPVRTEDGWSYPQRAAMTADLKELLAGKPDAEALRRAAWGAVAWAPDGILRWFLRSVLEDLAADLPPGWE